MAASATTFMAYEYASSPWDTPLPPRGRGALACKTRANTSGLAGVQGLCQTLLCLASLSGRVSEIIHSQPGQHLTLCKPEPTAGEQARACSVFIRHALCMLAGWLAGMGFAL